MKFHKISIQWQEVDHVRPGLEQLTEIWEEIPLESEGSALDSILKWQLQGNTQFVPTH